MPMRRRIVCQSTGVGLRSAVTHDTAAARLQITAGQLLDA
jgi:hypothetical protein